MTFLRTITNLCHKIIWQWILLPLGMIISGRDFFQEIEVENEQDRLRREHEELVRLQSLTIGDGYKILFKLDSGTYGDVYFGLKKEQSYAMKISKELETNGSLVKEYMIYGCLGKGKGIANIYWFGREQDRNILVMDVLGRNLESLMHKRCGGRFSLKTTCLIAKQALQRLEFIHSKGVLHRDIKPSNLLTGSIEDDYTIYLVDFGFSALYNERLDDDAPTVTNKKLGTPLFGSLNVQRNLLPSRRDDFESLIFVLIYFFTGSLPWIKYSNNYTTRAWNKVAKLKALPLETICEDCPMEFIKLLQHSRKLRFNEKPNYKWAIKVFSNLADKYGFQLDNHFDWVAPIVAG